MSGGSQPSGQQVVTQQSNTGPWAGQQPYLSDGFDIARQTLANQAANQQYYPGQGYVGPSTWTNNGINNMLARAVNVGAANAAPGERALGVQANNYLTRGIGGTPGAGLLSSTANGDMIGRNPEFQGMVSRGMEAVRPGIDSQFAGAGRLGSGAHANAMASAGANMAGNLAYGDYQQERGNQLNAASQLMSGDMQARQLGAGLLGQASTNDQNNINAMLQGGSMAEDYAGRALEADMNRWNYNQNKQWDQIGKYMSLIQGNYGSSGTTTQARPVYGGGALGNIFSGAGAVSGLLGGLGSMGRGFGWNNPAPVQGGPKG